jgi:2,3-bisphosphoglycerate-dependent phosphoglycerate mutase
VVTYVLRHARTAYSAAYRVNGRPDAPLGIDDVGYQQCHDARFTHPWDTIATCVVSRFPRTAQTAHLLLAPRTLPLVAEARLDEIDYGTFEGGPFTEYGRWLDQHGPWARPPGSRESQREAIWRMLDGLRDVLARPGPCLVVAHGLLSSVLRHGSVAGVYYPEAPYVTLLQFSGEELRAITSRLMDEIERDRPSAVSAAMTGGGLATFGHERVRTREEDRHA